MTDDRLKTGLAALQRVAPRVGWDDVERQLAQSAAPTPTLDGGRGHGRTGFRFLVALASAGVVVGLILLWPDARPDSVRTGPQPADQTSLTSPSPSASDRDTETPAPDDLLDLALWPDPDVQRFTDPSEAARSFVEEVMGIPDPPLSEFRELFAGGGEVDVFGREEARQTHDRAVSTIALGSTGGRWVGGRLEGAHWFVVAAISKDVRIDSPRQEGTVSSPVTVTGRGRGHEGTVIVLLRQRFASDTLSEQPAIAGSGETLEPFTVNLAFEPPGTSAGVIVARTDAGAEEGIPSFTALGVRFGDSAGPAG
ncbi:MAG TPA: Gmad2 immunoglobulin-like domain-containing protein [Jiangellaceae bacterium]|nr:Gmad2 immunoglobulin-like domain-containing protein [Jiangellaceae bacterium]